VRRERKHRATAIDPEATVAHTRGSLALRDEERERRSRLLVLEEQSSLLSAAWIGTGSLFMALA
jgi:hypothetical protein